MGPARHVGRDLDNQLMIAAHDSRSGQNPHGESPSRFGFASLYAFTRSPKAYTSLDHLAHAKTRPVLTGRVFEG